ncbi:MAG: hypothetical protein Ct9H300mP16_18850 [Pseudomonadota bacterium]|nr:MAG: hypothetical protein Ct9H300mP16_18850 [Pseudomonadota bacterium]
MDSTIARANSPSMGPVVIGTSTALLGISCGDPHPHRQWVKLFPEGAHVQGITELRGSKAFPSFSRVSAETRESQARSASGSAQSAPHRRNPRSRRYRHPRHAEPGKNLGGLHHASHVIEESTPSSRQTASSTRCVEARLAVWLRVTLPPFRGARLDHQYGLAGRAAATTASTTFVGL